MPRTFADTDVGYYDNSDTARQVFGTFADSFTKGITADWLDVDTKEMSPGVGKTLTELVGRIGGEVSAIGGATSIATAGLGMLGVAVGAPLLLGTGMALGYEWLRNTDMNTKMMNSAMIAITAGIINKVGPLLRKSKDVSKAGSAVKKAIGLAEPLEDVLGKESQASLIKTELRDFAYNRGIQNESIPTILTKAVQEYHGNAKVKKEIPTTLRAIFANYLGPTGRLNGKTLSAVKDVATEVDIVARKVLAKRSVDRGLQLRDDYQRTMIGGFVRKLKGQLSDVGNLLGEVPGGSKFFYKADDSLLNESLSRTAASTFFEGTSKKITKAIKNKPYWKDLSIRMSRALEDRANITKHLKNSDEIDIYNSFEGALDFWSEAMKSKGRVVRKNYFTHMSDTIIDPSKELGKVPREVAKAYFKMSEAYFKRRTGNIRNVMREDMMKTYKIYESWISKKLAFEDLLEEFEKSSKHPIITKFLNGVLENPDPGKDVISWMASTRFKNFLAYNPFSSTSNLSQQFLARAFTTPMGEKVARFLRKIDDPKLINFLNKRFVHFAESSVNKALKTAKVGKFDKLPEAIRKFINFETAESRNWVVSRSLGLADEIAKRPEFQNALKEHGMKKALNMMLKNDSVWTRGMRRGQDLAMKSQFPMGRGMKPGIFEAGSTNMLLKLPLQFKRFAVSNFESTWKLLVEGTKGKEVDIMRLGFQDEVPVVNRLRAMRVARKGAKRLIKETTSKEEKLAYKKLADELTEDMGFLTDEVNRLQPRTRLKSAGDVGLMIATGSAPKLARTWLKWGLIGYMFNKSYKRYQKKRDIKYIMFGQIPGLEMTRGMDLTARWSDPTWQIIANTFSYVPYLGAVDALLPGRPITRAAYEKVKKKKKKKRSYNTLSR